MTVLVTAKAPRPGHVKTRMCPPLGLATAARFAEAFLTDVLQSARAADPGAGLLCPSGDAADLSARFPGVEIVEQEGGGLADALAGAAATGAVLVSGDAPGIPPGVIAAGLASQADVVIAPSRDGGYCLIGARRFHPALFTDVAWSTHSVLDETIAAARAMGLSVELLDPVADVDTVDDLLAVDLARAPATADLLRSPDVAPFAPRRRPRVGASRTLHESPWRRLVVDRLDDGTEYAYLDTPRAVWVVPVTDDGDTMLVRQYRHPVRAHPLEAPAGSVGAGEDPRDAAIRELREEVGGTARSLERVGGFYSSSAHVSLEGLVYLATGVRFDPPTHAAAEGLELVRMPLARAVELAHAGELCESQSAMALVLAGRAVAAAR
jgi:rSAM/selenodomain-associated transferase 1